MRILILILMTTALAACKQTPELPAIISPYKIDIQQGNVVTQDMVDKLKAGLTRSQVRFVLGSPLVADMFHEDRWDYIYLMQRQGKPDERRRLTVIFDGDKLLRLDGDIVAADKPSATAKPIAAPAGATPAAKTEVAKPVEKSVGGKPEAARSGVAPAVSADAAKAETADEKKDPPKRGFFGRMLDKIGF